MNADKFNELKEKARESFRKAEALQELSDKELLRSRYNLDMAEAAFKQAEDTVKESGAADDSAAALDVKNAQQQQLAAEDRHREMQAVNEKTRLKLEESRAKFTERFGEQP